MNQLEKPDESPTNPGDYPPDAVPPRCPWTCNTGRERAGRVCIYWMTFRPLVIYTDFPIIRKKTAAVIYAKARWVYFDQHGCYMPPPFDHPLLQKGIADWHDNPDTDKPYTLDQAWANAKSGLQSQGAPPAGTIQPCSFWLESLNLWTSPEG